MSAANETDAATLLLANEASVDLLLFQIKPALFILRDHARLIMVMQKVCLMQSCVHFGGRKWTS